MYVQPYFPEQIEVHGNIAAEPYDLRLRFVRRVVGLHLLSACLVASSAIWLPSTWGLTTSGLLLLGALVALSIIRQIVRHGRIELVLSGAMLLPTLVLLGFVLRDAALLGWPTWALGFSVLGAGLYTLLSGRDFSFVGQFVCAGVLCGAGSIALGLALSLSTNAVLTAIVISLSGLFYYVYDLAALLTRRRRGEEISAVADLYRDVLNCVTYIGRVVQHWRRFRI